MGGNGKLLAGACDALPPPAGKRRPARRMRSTLLAAAAYTVAGLALWRGGLSRVYVSSGSTRVFNGAPGEALGDGVGMGDWVERLVDGRGRVESERVGCREYEAGAQSCVFEGVVCVDVGVEAAAEKLQVLLVDERQAVASKVAGDDWCTNRHQSADPRYFGPRHWPIIEGTVAPQWSCMNGTYVGMREVRARGGEALQNVKWVPHLSLVNLDYTENDHNNHLLMDVVHLLDTALWQESLRARGRPTGDAAPADLFERHVGHVLLPQSRSQFESQTGRDLNRFTYGLVLREDLARLYPGVSKAELRASRAAGSGRKAAPLLEAYPEWAAGERLLFYNDLRARNDVQLVCAGRMAVGSKLGNLGHERVCRDMRTRGWELFGVAPPPKRRVGQIFYNQPPARVLVLARHSTRKIGNLHELMERLSAEFGGRHGVEVELVMTDVLRTAEDYVRVFSRAGVLLTPHGSQAMGQIWMPRHATLVEIMPVGYTDYSFNLLADNCKIWYDELQSAPDPNRTVVYREHCAKMVPHMLSPCSAVKSMDVFVPLDAAVRVITLALERMGHPVGPWLDDAPKNVTTVESNTTATAVSTNNSSQAVGATLDVGHLSAYPPPEAAFPAAKKAESLSI